MTSNCESCIFARGKQLQMTYSPGDNPGDAIFCSNVEFLNDAGIEVYNDPDLGHGALVYRIEVIEGPEAVCESGSEA